MKSTDPRGASLYLGPAGWSYADWNGIVYPIRRSRSRPQLAYLARYFNAVEINTSFYHIPRPRQCEKWSALVEPFEDFLFSVKLWRGFTHVREQIDSGDLNRWHAAMEPLRRAGRLGCVLIQFPWSYKRTPQNARYLEALTLALAPDPLAIEVRHDSWENDEFLVWLRENGYAFCNIDQPRLHRCLPPTEHHTAALAYVRLHGRNEENWFRDDAGVNDRYRYLYSRTELTQWVERLRRLIEKAEKVFVVTNNHVEGRAATNALQIKSLLTGKKVEAPPPLVRHYPELADFVNVLPGHVQSEVREGEQLTLF